MAMSCSVAVALAMCFMLAPLHAEADQVISFDFGIPESLVYPEITTGGNGNGEFQMYVNSNRTSYVANRTLYIKPTLSEHIMEDLNSAGNLFVAKTRAFINQTAQPWTYDNDFYYGGPFAGRRMVLPYKHVRYQTPLNNTCDDTSSSNPDPNTCTNQWAHAYNLMDMTTQAWGSGRWPHIRCSHDCILTAGDYVAEGAVDYTYTLLQPVSSTKLVTRTTVDVRFGRVEFTAKLPRGDWLWPAMWMLPSFPDNYFGIWPSNGEIDVMESRGNDPAQCPTGYNFFGSTLHWGVDYTQDAYRKASTGVQYTANNRTLTDDFHVYGLVWNETGVWTYIDDEANIVLALDMSGETFWGYSQTDTNTCALKTAEDGFDKCTATSPSPAFNWTGNYANPWEAPRNFSEHMSPFDAPFYLILNVAVGGTNGFFGDNCFGTDGSPAPWSPAAGTSDDDVPTDAFMKGGHHWLPTWVEPNHFAWAAHCILGSAYEQCMPANTQCPVSDMATPGAGDKLKDWYTSKASACTSFASEASCTANASCEWHDVPCPPTADHAALQIKQIAITSV